MNVLEEEETGFLKSVLEESDEMSETYSNEDTTDAESAVHSGSTSKEAKSTVVKSG